MCGICGGLTQPNANIIKALLIANEKRGDKSTGIAYRIGEKTSISKDAIPATKFIEQIKDNLIDKSNLVICHTRMPSVGAVGKKNAHPFRYNSVVGVHNGTVSNHLDVKYSGDVDSLAIFHLLSQKKNNFEQVFPELMGSMAVVWVYDGDPNLFMIRHVSPLSMAKVGNTLYFNSELLTLQSVLQAAGLDPKAAEDLEEDFVYTITPSLEITKTTVTFKSYYQAPNFPVVVYPLKDEEEKEQYGLAPEYSFPPGPTAPISARTRTNHRNYFVSEDRGPWERRGDTAPLAFEAKPGQMWSMRQIFENYHIFDTNGKLIRKVFYKKAKKPLLKLLGQQGFNLIKDVRDEDDFARAIMEGFGCQICHHMAHLGFWYDSSIGMVYCNLCTLQKEYIKNHSKYINVKKP